MCKPCKPCKGGYGPKMRKGWKWIPAVTVGSYELAVCMIAGFM